MRLLIALFLCVALLTSAASAGIIPAPLSSNSIAPSNTPTSAADKTTTFELSGGAVYNGEVSMTGSGMTGSGSVRYSNGDQFVGNFKNGKPDGPCVMFLADQTAYVFNFRDGLLLSTYRAKQVDPYKAQTILPFRADNPQPFQAQTIEVYQAPTIATYQADTIQTYSADSIKSYQADTIKPFSSDTISAFSAEAVDPVQAQAVATYTSSLVEAFQATPVQKQDPALTVEAYAAEVAKLTAPSAVVEKVTVVDAVSVHNDKSPTSSLTGSNPTSTSNNAPSGNNAPSNTSSSSSGSVPASTSAVDYSTPLQQAWMAHMAALPYLVYGGMRY